MIQIADLPLAVSDLPSTTLSLEEVEKRHIQQVLDQLDGNVTRAARALGIDRVTLYNKIRRYDLRRSAD
jgi:transcriptional regulator of acetoin/glycerol metabolism